MDYLQYSECYILLYRRRRVLNLIINGLPSIRWFSIFNYLFRYFVLNLIINGLPSIHNNGRSTGSLPYGFKPYYKWITFNTIVEEYEKLANIKSFKPYYKWITFNTRIMVIIQ